jgi:O-glycosyl hydrolase
VILSHLLLFKGTVTPVLACLKVDWLERAKKGQTVDGFGGFGGLMDSIMSLILKKYI